MEDIRRDGGHISRSGRLCRTSNVSHIDPTHIYKRMDGPANV